MMLAAPTRFYDALRSGVASPELTQSEVNGFEAVLAACSGWPISWLAYGLGTCWHETGHTMQPVREIGSDAYFQRLYDPLGQRPQVAHQLGNSEPGDGKLFAGKGFVQLTGRANYDRADRELGLGSALVENPDLALRPDTAAQIMERGMRSGWFTGRKLVDFLPIDRLATRAEFMAARRIINGTDRADLIADYATRFQDALTLGGWA